MKASVRFTIYVCFCILAGSFSVTADPSDKSAAKPSPDAVIKMLKDGNKRFYSEKTEHPNISASRFELAGKESQAKYAYATILACSDSRVPVALIFDVGVMDIFVVRVAGNVCGPDELASIEYGLSHVETPVLVVMGHTQCGAVKVAVDEAEGKVYRLEKNIPQLIDRIVPAAKRAMAEHKSLKGDAVIPYAEEENVWQAIDDLFTKSPDVRKLVKEGRAKVVGAMYDVGTGKVDWLSDKRVNELLAKESR